MIFGLQTVSFCGKSTAARFAYSNTELLQLSRDAIGGYVHRLTLWFAITTPCILLGAPMNCVPGTLNDYLNLDPVVGCRLGDRVLSEFALTPLTFGSAEIDPGSVLVTPSTLGMSGSLLFTYNAAASNAGVLESVFQMNVTPADGGSEDIVDLRLIDAAAAGDAVVLGIVDLCEGFQFPGFCSGASQTLIATVTSFDDFSFATGRISRGASYGLTQDIVLDAGPNGSASLKEAQLTFTAVPEPTTVVTLVTGLVTLSVLRRRKFPIEHFDNARRGE